MTAGRIEDDPPQALTLQGIRKRYGAVVALDGASIAVRPGTVHALLGENGAGKTTLMRIAFGLAHPDEGMILVDGRAKTFSSAGAAIESGIGMVHQHFTLVPAMTVAENIALGGRGVLDIARVVARTREVADTTGFTLDPSTRVESLPIGAQQRVEILKAIVRGARILILDEPTAVLAPAEVTDLLNWLRAFADAGNTVVLITHKLPEALGVADDVTILRRGRTVMTARADSVTPETLTRAMIGDDTFVADEQRETTPAPTRSSTTVFRADHLTVIDDSGIARVRDATFAIGGGEIVGIAAIEGSGQRELLRALAGRTSRFSGSLERPSAVGFVPEDRHGDAVLLDRDVAENVALRGAGERRGIVDWSSVRSAAAHLMRAFDVRAAGTHAAMRTLSGGNQQKLVLARELGPPEQQAHAIVAENPTRGLDVRATIEVHAHLRRICAGGAAIVLYSSDIDEVLLLATRVLVVFAGVVREVMPDREQIGRAMLGLH